MSEEDENKMTLLGFFFEVFKTIFLAILIAFVLRTFLFQPFHIPSPSMEPTLYKGDYVITTKYSLGYGKHAATPFELPISERRVFEKTPIRGDIIVFKVDGKADHVIKRLIGLPGDRIQMVDGKLYLNEARQHTIKIADDTQTSSAQNLIRTSKYKETLAGSRNAHVILDILQGSEADNTEIFVVPDGHYFFMGDNRDNSADSRLPVDLEGIGFVPAINLVGRAEFVLLAVNEEFKLVKPWTWGNIRGERLFKGLR